MTMHSRVSTATRAAIFAAALALPAASVALAQTPTSSEPAAQQHVMTQQQGQQEAATTDRYDARNDRNDGFNSAVAPDGFGNLRYWSTGTTIPGNPQDVTGG